MSIHRDAADEDLHRPGIISDTEPASPWDGLLWIHEDTGLAQVWDEGESEWLPVGRQAEAQADSTAADTAGIVADFNSFLAKLRAAGILADSV